MKNEIQIEKMFCVKGCAKYFKTEMEAQNYAKEILLKDCKESIKRAYYFIKEYKKSIKRTRMFAKEANWNKELLKRFWCVKTEYGDLYLYSSRTECKIKIPYDIDLDSKKGLRFARETVKYYCAKKIKLIEEQIRHQKSVTKKAQKQYGEIRSVK